MNVGCDRIRLVQFGDHAQGWAFDYRDWRGLMKEVIEGYDQPTVCHNLLYDSKMLKADGIVIPEKYAHDSMVMAFLHNPASKIGLKATAAKLVDKRATHGQSMLGQAMSAGRWTWETIPIDHPAYWQYGVLDTVLTSLLASRLWPETGGGPYKRAYDIELGCIHVLREAEIAGMMTDADYRARATAQLHEDLDRLRPIIPIKNPGSDAQVRDYLLKLGAPLFVRTEAGNLSVDKEVLKWLEPSYPVCGPISEYRSKSRMLSNYFEKMDDLSVRGAVHASTKPVGARTGRMSVTDPPLQTLPRGRLVRDAFIAREGMTFVGADFKGMEMRALASFAQETNMLAAFTRGEDLHDFVAAACYGTAFTKQQRGVCKSAAFAKIYGAGLEQFAVTAQIPVSEAKAFLDRYDLLFPGVGGFMQKVSSEIMTQVGGNRGKDGWVELIDGRRLPVEGDKPYVGVNYKIQGSCAVSTKEKIVELANAGLEEFFRLAVHDELIFECPLELRHDVRAVIEEVMPDRYNFPGVTLEVDSDIFGRWGEHYREDYDAYLPTELSPWLELEAA